MVYEDISFRSGETLSQVANNYGYGLGNWKVIWDHPANSKLKALRGTPNKINKGDQLIIPIPWVIHLKQLVNFQQSNGRPTFRLTAKRNGEKGEYIRWVQTVFQDNQPIGRTSTFCADACPGDDNDPFYYTSTELASQDEFRKSFYDAPWRNPHSQRSTAWRAVLSVCSVSNKRVSVFESIVWGIDFGMNGKNIAYSPRKATNLEVTGHLRLLRMGEGVSKSFKSQGWTFRAAPKNY